MLISGGLDFLNSKSSCDGEWPLRDREIGGFILLRDKRAWRLRRCRKWNLYVTKRRGNVRPAARWIAHPFECDEVVREQAPIRLHPLAVRRPFVWSDVSASQRLEFASQCAELFAEARVFGAEIRELFCRGQFSCVTGM